MRMSLKRFAWIVVMAVGIVITGGTALVAASQSPQEQRGQDYSKNKNYQQGKRDGRDDAAHNRDHSKKRHFKKDEDRKAYEQGYQESRRGNPPEHR